MLALFHFINDTLEDFAVISGMSGSMQSAAWSGCLRFLMGSVSFIGII